MKGTIEYRIKTGGGIDDKTGDPIPVSNSWSDPIECEYFSKQFSNTGKYQDGTFQQVSFVIYIEDMDFIGEFIQLINSKGETVCQMPVLSNMSLDEIQRVQLVI